ADGPITAMNITHLAVREAEGSYTAADLAAEGSVSRAEMDAEGPITAYGITNIDVAEAVFSYKSDGEPLTGTLSRFSLGGSGALDLDGVINEQPLKASGTLASIADLMAR